MQLLPTFDPDISTAEDDTPDSKPKIPGSCKDNRRNGLATCCCNSQNKHGGTMYVCLASAMAALGGVLFGYDTGVISGALLQLTTDFELDCQQQQIIVSSLMLGAVLASLSGGFLIDYCGRKTTIIANDVLFLIGSLILTFSPSYISLVFGRIVVGFGVALSATAECVYISEISPPARRGFLVSLNELGITIGFLLAYLSSYVLITVPSGWRYMFALSGILAIFQGFGMFFLPQSPRYLMIKGKHEQARTVLSRLLGDEEAESEFEIIRSSIAEQTNISTKDLCLRGRNLWSALAIALMLVFLQQMSGQPSLLYYAPMIFQEVGFKSNTSAVLASVGLGFVKMMCTVFYILIVDKVGRRTFLLVGTGLMMVSITVLGIILNLFNIGNHLATSCDIPAINSTVPHNGSPFNSSFTASPDRMLFNTTGALSNVTMNVETVTGASTGTWIAMVMVLLYIAGYAIGFGPGTWLIMSEIFPAYIKGRAMSVSSTFNWATNLVVSMTMLSIITSITSSWTFIGYGIVCAISVFFIFFAVPETKGKSLERISYELQKNNLFCCCCCDGTPMISENAVIIRDDFKSTF